MVVVVNWEEEDMAVYHVYRNCRHKVAVAAAVVVPASVDRAAAVDPLDYKVDFHEVSVGCRAEEVDSGALVDDYDGLVYQIRERLHMWVICRRTSRTEMNEL